MFRKYAPLLLITLGALYGLGCGRLLDPFDPPHGGGGHGGRDTSWNGDTVIIDPGPRDTTGGRPCDTAYVDPRDTNWVDPRDTSWVDPRDTSWVDPRDTNWVDPNDTLNWRDPGDTLHRRRR